MVIAKSVTVVVKKMIKIKDYQLLAKEKLESGSILCGGVGSGKSITALLYYFEKECGGKINQEVYVPMKKTKPLFIITTAKKRDSLEWEGECTHFLLKPKIDSWNNIGKYTNIENAFFIFDEQRVVGSGSWVKSFLKITKKNNWLLLSATPGDTWLDYAPVFIANGFYKNITEFKRRHVVYSNFTKFPKISHYVEVARLIRLKKLILVNMDYIKKTTTHHETIVVPYDKNLMEQVVKKRWNMFTNKPIKNVSEFFYTMRKVVNSDGTRVDFIKSLLEKHSKIIVFYNFDYELELLKVLSKVTTIAEWNGHKHQPIPKTKSWIYLVQYTSGAEGWNCIETNCIVFYSQSYSYRATIQAAGRIDRLDTTFNDLYYYHIRSNSAIDLAIEKALKKKKNFNEGSFLSH